MKDYDKIFMKREQKTQDKTTMMISILVDSSGSVGNEQHKIQLDTTYLMSKALEQTKNKSEVIEFSGDGRGEYSRQTDEDKFKVIKKFNQKTEQGDFKRHFHCGNELNPALKYALKSLNKEMIIKNKFVIVITDGNLEADGNTEEEMQSQVLEFKKNNIPVYCILVNPDDDNPYKFFDKVISVNEFSELMQQLKKLIIDIQKKVMIKNI